MDKQNLSDKNTIEIAVKQMETLCLEILRQSKEKDKSISNFLKKLKEEYCGCEFFENYKCGFCLFLDTTAKEEFGGLI